MGVAPLHRGFEATDDFEGGYWTHSPAFVGFLNRIIAEQQDLASTLALKKRCSIDKEVDLLASYTAPREAC